VIAVGLQHRSLRPTYSAKEALKDARAFTGLKRAYTKVADWEDDASASVFGRSSPASTGCGESVGPF